MYYTTIEDLPVYNWNKIIEAQKYNYILLNPLQKDYNENECKNQFALIYEEFIDVFGINEQLRGIIELQNEITIHKIDIALGEKSLEALLKLTETKLKKKLEKKESKGNLTKVYIEKFLGFRLNEKEVTVYEYYNYIKALENVEKNK
jgi:hypothetical protein